MKLAGPEISFDMEAYNLARIQVPKPSQTPQCWGEHVDLGLCSLTTDVVSNPKETVLSTIQIKFNISSSNREANCSHGFKISLRSVPFQSLHSAKMLINLSLQAQVFGFFYLHEFLFTMPS